ncbi:recombinase family protein [Candidatus Merdisoma sp. JLR.KK006]|jgi:DNA invertase Pin-like site-specific DNA recombinase|uniref:recombinase family protein n=1 Tax=Candidatus Merdisoma sp. JLR.KK006 TaxID=3112626 RepID=UPI002FEE8B8A
MKKNVYGYVRVSTREQNVERQLIALEKIGVPQAKIFIDRQSGKDFRRPAYQKMVKKLKAGDIVVTKSIDRLGRNYEEIKEQWRILTKEIGADIIIQDMPLLDTTKSRDLLGSFISDVVLQLLSFVAENERNNIRIRQAEGIEAAKRRGVRFGKPAIPVPENFSELYLRWEQGSITINEFAQLCNMGRSTIYKRIGEYKKN